MARRRRTSADSEGRRIWQAPLVFLAGLAVVSGVTCLVLDAVQGPTQSCRALGGLLLILSGGLQIFLWRRTRCSRQPAAGLWISQSNRFFLWLLAGWLGCYVAALAVGPRLGIAWLFCGLFTLWSTALFDLVAMRPRIPDVVLRIFHSYWSVALARVAILLLLAFVSAELGLRSYGLLTGDPLTARYMVQQLKPQPGTELFGRRVNSLGYADDEFQREREPGVFRVAVVGDELALTGCEQRRSAVALEGRLAGIEVYNFGVPRAGPREYAAVFVGEAAGFQPDLLVCFVSVEDDITGQIPTPGWFDWRGLRTCQLLDGRLPTVVNGAPASEAAARCGGDDAESQYFRHIGARLAVCRSPMAPAVQRQWGQTLDQLQFLADRCQRQGTALGIVAIPGQFQVNPVLAATLQRRAGCAKKSLDLELPQRRLTAFAQETGLPLLDLLPHLRVLGASAFRHHDSQLSDLGRQAVSEAVADWLHSSYGEQIAAVTRGDAVTAARVTETALRR